MYAAEVIIRVGLQYADRVKPSFLLANDCGKKKFIRVNKFFTKLASKKLVQNKSSSRLTKFIGPYDHHKDIGVNVIKKKKNQVERTGLSNTLLGHQGQIYKEII